MDMKSAGNIKLADYINSSSFNNLCTFAYRNGYCTDPERFSHTTRSGITYNCPALVRQAEESNCAAKGKQCAASMSFVLNHLDLCCIPFNYFDDSAHELAQRYNTYLQGKYNEMIDEKTAMAAILMIAIGNEQRKLSALRKLCARHNNHVENVQDKDLPKWKIVQSEQYAKYHVDLIAYKKGKILEGYQVERKSSYYDFLEFKKETRNIHPSHRAEIDRNRTQLNRFLDDFPGIDISLLTYSVQQNKNHKQIALDKYGQYSRVEPIGQLPIS